MNQSLRDNRPFDLNLLKEITLKLLTYCKKHNWAGYDPYDALNSRLFRALPFLNIKVARLALTQGVKRCPVNLRPLLLIPKTQNPKGIAIFLSALVKLAQIGMVDGDKEIAPMAQNLLTHRSPGIRQSCWGYSFDWQTRTYLVPKGSPNIICSTFAANALLDAYEHSRNSVWLEVAADTAEFILDKLFWREDASKACFSYTPIVRTDIHNANLLGAALLCRVSRMTAQKKFIEPAIEAAQYSVSKQHEDGGWAYGESPRLDWIDNFHTGYNLVALRRIRDDSGIKEFDASMLRGFNFFLNNFFTKDTAPKYYHNCTFPIDIHSVAQSIITCVEYDDFLENNAITGDSVTKWAWKNMWNQGGFFYFQKHRHYTVRTPFMRWSQAWMLNALSALLRRKMIKAGLVGGAN